MKNRNFGLILFIVPWLIILCVPTLRLILRAQVQGSDLMTVYQGPSSTDWANAEARVARQQQQLAVRYPDDARVLARNVDSSYRLKCGALEAEGTLQTQQEALLRQAISDYDALIRRFPGQAWLIADRLRFTSQLYFSDRVAEFDPVVAKPNFTSRSQIAYSADDLRQTIAIAQQGQQLEPDNNFYDWIIAGCLYGLRRDDEVLAVLHLAASKPRYDAHIKDDVLAKIAGLEQTRPLLSEEKWMAMTSELLPQYASHNQTARFAVVEGARAERAGDHQRALGIYQNVARLGKTMREDNYFFICSFCGIYIERMAWSGKNRQAAAEERDKYGNAARAVEQLAAQKFALYATSHGRPDIAAETQREAQAIAKFHDLITPVLVGDGVLFGADSRALRLLSNLWWASASLLPQLLLNIALWLGLSLILRYRLAPRRETVGWLDVSSVLVINGCVTLVLIALGLYFGTGWAELWTSNPPLGHPALMALLSKLLMLTPAVLGALLCGCGMIWRQPLNGRPSSFAYGLACYHKMLGAFITLMGFTYLLLSAASLPARHTINARLDIGIQQGQMALLQTQNSKP